MRLLMDVDLTDTVCLADKATYINSDIDDTIRSNTHLAEGFRTFKRHF